MRTDARSLARLACLLALVTAVPVTVAAVKHWQNASRMSQAAQTLIGTLDSSQREAAQFPLNDAGRTDWSNLPVLMVPRTGVMVGDMNAGQRKALHDLLRASLSSQGYAKVTSVMRLDDLLHELAATKYEAQPETERRPLEKAFVDTYSYGHYAVAIFGDPAGDDWGWRLTGHHVAANFTVSGGRVGFTPLFLGSSPREVEGGPLAGLMALPKEGSRGIDLMNSLSDEQRQKALLSAEVTPDIFEGPGRRASLQKFEGLKASALDEQQQRLLRVLVQEYVGDAEFDTADAQLAAIADAGWGELWFSWRGQVDPGGRFYYRVHGPRLLIEYNRQDENHDHMIVRDPKNDYGDDWFGQHLAEHHPTLEEARENAHRQAESQ